MKQRARGGVGQVSGCGIVVGRAGGGNAGRERDHISKVA